METQTNRAYPLKNQPIRVHVNNHAELESQALSSSIQEGITITKIHFPGSFSAVVLRGNVKRPIRFFSTMSQFAAATAYCFQGSLLLQRHNDKAIMGPDSVTFCSDTEPTDVLIGRGESLMLKVYWQRDQIKAIANVLENLNPGIQVINIASTNENSWHKFSDIRKKLKTDSQLSELEILSSITDSLSLFEQHVSEKRRDFLGVPIGIKGNLHNLLEQVAKSPTEDWSLKRAAEVSNYSPFHLSRLMRQETSLGFPKFVDRCRLNLVKDEILFGSKSFEKIAKQAGFTALAGLRKASKDHTGLLPSELRHGRGQNQAEYDSSSQVSSKEESN